MILEGLVTTRSVSGEMHLAPMGPMVFGDFEILRLRPFPSSTTFRNLQRDSCGVFHITDDARLIAYAAVGGPKELPASIPAEIVNGYLLKDCCRAYEFRVTELDTTGERMVLDAEVLKVHRFRDFLGFNRAKHAVIEAAILATRFHLSPMETIEAEFRKLRVIVDKTAGPEEFEAFEFLEMKLRETGGER